MFLEDVTRGTISFKLKVIKIGITLGISLKRSRQGKLDVNK